MNSHNIVLKGCGTALITPFNNGVVDVTALRSLVQKQLEADIDFLVPLGTTAETPCLDNDEKIQILEIIREQLNKCNKSIPLVVGVGTNSLKATLANINLVKDYADAFLVVVPYYNKPTQRGQYEYFKALSKASDKPIIMYNVPGRTGANMTADTCIRLAKDCPSIIGIKEASANKEQIKEIIDNAPEDFAVFSGNDDETLSHINMGGAGIISVASNIAPKMMKELVETKNEQLYNQLYPFFKACFKESNPIPVKAALASLGLISNELRLPLVAAEEDTYNLMSQLVKDLR